MNTRKLNLSIMAGVLGLAVQAHATLFQLDYSDPSGDVLTGLITATSLGNSQYLATSASLTLISANFSQFNGSYSLVPGGPGNNTGVPGFQFDNVLFFPGQPIVDFSGVLSVESSSGTLLNLFSADANGNPVSIPGPSDYALLAQTPSGQTEIYAGGINQGGPATATLTPVPETTTMVAGSLLLLPLLASGLRTLRKRQSA